MNISNKVTGAEYKTCPFNKTSDLLNKSIFLDSLSTNHLNIIRNKNNVLLGDRCKMSHRIGSTAKCEFVSTTNSPYSGLWKGCSNVLIRISLTIFNSHYDENVVEYYDSGIGVGLKFFRDIKEEHSADVVLLSNHSHKFRDDFKFESNLLKDDQTTTVNFDSTTNTIFKNVSTNPGEILLDNIGEYDQYSKLSENNFNPKVIFLRPEACLYDSYEKNNKFPNMLLNKELLCPEKIIYKVYDENNLHIGNIVLKSHFILSEFADNNLHFFHNMKFNSEPIINDSSNFMTKLDMEDLNTFYIFNISKYIYLPKTTFLLLMQPINIILDFFPTFIKKSYIIKILLLIMFLILDLIGLINANALSNTLTYSFLYNPEFNLPVYEQNINNYVQLSNGNSKYSLIMSKSLIYILNSNFISYTIKKIIISAFVDQNINKEILYTLYEDLQRYNKYHSLVQKILKFMFWSTIIFNYLLAKIYKIFKWTNILYFFDNSNLYRETFTINDKYYKNFSTKIYRENKSFSVN
jgi:hypothetical protein